MTDDFEINEGTKVAVTSYVIGYDWRCRHCGWIGYGLTSKKAAKAEALEHVELYCKAKDANPEFVREWDVYRDADGNVVTITEDQLHAIWSAINLVERVRRSEGYASLWDNAQPNLFKSRLLGRILLHGLPPTKTKPPVELGGPAWWALPGGDPFAETESAA